MGEPHGRRRRPTQVDIARRLGVSQATVSLVISGGPQGDQVAESTRRAVVEAAAELGYSVNSAARSLKGGRNRLLGLYTFEQVFPVDQRDFYFPFLLGVEEEAADQGYDLLLFSSAGSSGDRRIYTGGENRLKVADGCVLLGRQLHRDDLAHLVREDFPFVFIGRREVPGARLSFVTADYETATRQIVTTLASHGHRRMVYVQVASDEEPTRDREQGFRDGLAAIGHPGESLIHRVSDTAEITPDLLDRWCREQDRTAIIVEPTEHGTTPLAVEQAAAAAGLDIPRDVSVALLGDPPLNLALANTWTRFALPRIDMGREAVRLLIDLLDAHDDEPRQLYVPCEQIAGETVAAARSSGGAR